MAFIKDLETLLKNKQQTIQIPILCVSAEKKLETK